MLASVALYHIDTCSCGVWSVRRMSLYNRAFAVFFSSHALPFLVMPWWQRNHKVLIGTTQVLSTVKCPLNVFTLVAPHLDAVVTGAFFRASPLHLVVVTTQVVCVHVKLELWGHVWYVLCHVLITYITLVLHVYCMLWVAGAHLGKGSHKF